MSEHINPSTRIVRHISGGEAVEYACPFIIWNEAGIEVYIDDVLQASNSYRLEGIGEKSGCAVIFEEAPEKDAVVCFIGHTVRERAVDYNQYVTLTAKSMNLDADYQETQIQENTTACTRALLVPISDGLPDKGFQLPSKEERKDSYLAFDEDGYPIAVGDAANVVSGLRDIGSTPGAVMIWGDATGLQAADSKRVFGQPNGAATLDENGQIPDAQLPKRGHEITNNDQPVEYRKILDFSDEFVVWNHGDANKIRSNLQVVHMGGGQRVIDCYDGHGVLKTSTIKAGTNIGVRQSRDGAIEISTDAAIQQLYSQTFITDDWGTEKKLIIPSEVHGLGETNELLVNIRDEAGDEINCAVNVSNDGTVTVQTDCPFTGKLMIHGGVVLSKESMINPMHTRGDIIVSNEYGIPDRLGIGEPGQVLGVNDTGSLEYKTLGAAAWKEANVAGGVLLLDEDNEIPLEFLPYSSMTYKGTFGSAESATGGDLPIDNVHAGDMYVCDQLFISEVAGTSFNIGDQAIYSGVIWEKLPSNDMINPMSARGDLIIGGTSGSPDRLPPPSANGKFFLQAQVTNGVPVVDWGKFTGTQVINEWHSTTDEGFYRVWGNGWVEQGGVFTVDGYNGVWRDLYIAYRDTLYSVQLTNYNMDTSAVANVLGKRVGQVLVGGHGQGGAGFQTRQPVHWLTYGFADIN